ncbi:MAG: hypothetical protein KKF48_04005 [Nanoarchaeota archaeon]|nr:hypothetical protein [Nanoarchaeota archaeon]MBU1028182.1 hypothetical protein [Nanoarchaeota archaeon]
MGVLDQVTQMRNQGIPEQDIIHNLQEQGVSPKAISDALNQSQIKNAVYGQENLEEYQPSINNQEMNAPEPISEEYYPQNQESQKPRSYAPYTQEYSDQEYAPQNQNYDQAYEQENYQPGYGNQEPYQQDYDRQEAPQQGYDTYAPEENYSDSIIEISEQVFSEKMKKTQKKLDELTEFKTLAETKIQHLEISLKKIENIIDKLQIAILEKIGSYGQNLSSIKKEMSMMQDSFRKVATKKHTMHSESKTSKKKTSKRK